jgi:hypothetical protein
MIDGIAGSAFSHVIDAEYGMGWPTATPSAVYPRDSTM